ncbi:MAG: InlB B-repeat-containing protein [Treponema sp.]|nr:InlB B-repeat-containing protein [Treponema sp.]
MKTNHFFVMPVVFSLLLSSCQNIISRIEEKSAEKQGGATISLSINETGARTALPELELSDLTAITLSYQDLDSEGGIIAGLTELGEWNSVSEMAGDTINFKTGTYTFTLTAESDVLIFEETKSFTITSGGNSLTFTPKLLSFDNSEPYGKGNLNVDIRYDNDGIAAVTGCLYTLEGDRLPGYAEESLEIGSGGNSSYRKTNIPSGNYILLFKFYADTGKTLLRGSYREYCSIVHKKTSSSECVLGNMGSLFNITYELNGGAFASGTTSPGSYTRQSAAITLPTALAKTDSTFGGWYEQADFSGSAVTEIASGNTGNKIFYARWLENATITFDTNATGAGITTTSQTVIKGVETALTSATALGLTNSRGRFLGWAKEAAATEATYSDGGAITVSGNTTLYAIWSVASIYPQSKGDSTDTDGDGLTDWDEIYTYFTDPSNKDTDGDGWNDGVEINGMYNVNNNSFNPLIADTPLLEIRMTAKPDIGYKYTISETKNDTISISENDGYTGSASTTSTNTKTHNEVHGWSQNLGISVAHEWGAAAAGYKNVTTVSEQTGYNGSISSGDSYTYSQSASEGWSKSWTNGKSTAISNGRNVSGGAVRIPVRFKNPSYIAYTVQNVTVALYRIPTNAGEPRVFVKNLTLSSEKSFTIAPLAESGDFELTADLSIAQTENLLKWSTGFEIEVSGYNITLQKEGQGSNDFTDALTEVKAKTASIYIDWGNMSGRSARTFNVSVKNRYNTSAQSIEDLYTAPTLDYIFQTMLHYTKGSDYELNENGCLDSFFTVSNALTGGAYTDGAWFILHKYTENGERYQAMYAPYTESIANGWSFENIRLNAGDEVYIFYSVDKDGDGVPLNEELIYGTSDTVADTDGDGLSDFGEIYGWYKSGIGLESKYSDNNKVYSSAVLTDTDGDELQDYSTNSSLCDNDPIVPKLKNDTRLGTCRYAKANGAAFTPFSFDSNDSCTLSGFYEYIWLDIAAKVSFATVEYKVGSSGSYQSIDKANGILLSVGTNYIYIRCTAPDTQTTKEYVLTVQSTFRPMNKFAVKTTAYEGGKVALTWDKYADERAAASDGGYILYGKKGGTTAKSLTLSDIAQASTNTSGLKDKGEFYLALTDSTLASSVYSLSELSANTNYSLYLFAYAHKGSADTFKSASLASKTFTTPTTRTAELKFYAHYVYDWKDQDGGCDPQYYWSFRGGELDLSPLNIGASSKKEFDDDDDKTYCFGEPATHKYNHDPEKFSNCTKTLTKTFNRTKDYSFTATWEATEYDSGSGDDYLGKVTAVFSYKAATDTWSCSWSSTCGASGSSTIRAGERSGKQPGGGYWDGNRWELHNSKEGEIDFHWDWSWDY